MYFITGKAISRRKLLRGLGATVALPWLDAMVPASLYGRSAAEPLSRFQAIYVPNGMAMPYWSPVGEGSDFELSPILEPLAPFRDQMLVLSGINTSWSSSHNGASGHFLTGVAQGGRNEVDVVAGVSMDQLLAREFGKETQVPSLELSLDPPNNAGSCAGQLSCVYTHTLSWRSAREPMPVEYNPRAIFERLFGDSGSTERGPREARLKQQQSVLDAVLDDLGGLKRQLGSQDRVRVEQYTEAVWGVEQRIQVAESQLDIELPDMEQPQGVPTDYEEYVELMQDLQLLALETDLTRVITFMMGKEQSTRVYPQAGVTVAHHPLSHHNNEPDRVALMSKINRYHMELFSKYLAKLRATPDGNGSLLDNMIIMYGAGLSNSTLHRGNNLPLLVLGGAAGRIKGGRHLTYSDQPTTANLLVTLMDKLGMPIERIGASTGKLPLNTLSEV